MNPDFTNIELLTKYLDGELHGEELKNLEMQITRDAELQEELDTLKISLQAVKSYGLYKNVGAVHAEMMKEFKNKPLPKIGGSNRFIRNTLKIAATIIVLLGSVITYQYIILSSTSLFQNNFQQYTLHENRSSKNQSLLVHEYGAGNYSKAIELLQGEPSPTLQDYFIAGNAALRQNNPEEATKYFLMVRQLNASQQTHLYQDDTEYYLAMSYLRNNEVAKAIPLFEKIHDNKNHLYHSKAGWWFMKKLHLLQRESQP